MKTQGLISNKITEFNDISLINLVIDEATLLLMDVDNTLIELNQSLGTPGWFTYFYNKQLENGATHWEAMRATVAIYVKINKLSDVKLIDAKMPLLIKKWQEKGIITLGLTSRDNGLFETTIRQLTSVNINLNFGKFKNKQLRLKTGDRSKFQHGIIYAGGMHKGKCLEEFFSLVKWRPKKIVFIDDQIRNLKEVEEISYQNSIEYIGFHYCALKNKVAAINCKIYDIQLEYLNQTNKLLSDQEAEEVLHSDLN